jgi:chromosome condensin MukBEF ATPase and DNA-binding subunit MukB
MLNRTIASIIRYSVFREQNTEIRLLNKYVYNRNSFTDLQSVLENPQKYLAGSFCVFSVRYDLIL